MPHVVAQPCVGCRHTECVAACPADCFVRGENVLVIDPEACIDCGACVGVCPVDAIYDAEDLPSRWAAFGPLNAALARAWAAEGRRITEPSGPLPDAAAWSSEPLASTKGVADVDGLPLGWTTDAEGL